MAKVLRIDKRLPDTWQAALGDFLAWKQAQGVAARTLSDYQEHVTRLFTRFPDAYDPGTVRQRVLAYMAEDVAPATANIRRAYLKAFFSWCVREGIFPENPLADVASLFCLTSVSPQRPRDLPVRFLRTTGHPPHPRAARFAPNLGHRQSHCKGTGTQEGKRCLLSETRLWCPLATEASP